MAEFRFEFVAPNETREAIIKRESGKAYGRIRIKPATVLWKPANYSKYFSVSLEEFAAWITDPSTRARRVDR